MEEDKKTVIVEKVTSVPLSEWIFVREQGMYDRYETTLNGAPIKMWECVSDGGSPYVAIYDCHFWDGTQKIIAPFFRKLKEYTEKKEKEKAEKMIDEIYNKLYGK